MRRYRLVVLALLLLGFATPSAGQDWPNKPIRVTVPYSAGSASDIIPRTVFARAEKLLGQPLIVENRGGGAGTIGTGFVARAAPDGYTILSTSSAHTTVPLTMADLSYDPRRDFAAVFPLASMANVMVVSPSKGFKTLADFVAYARAHSGSINYATVGAGSAAHLNSERFRLSAGFDAQPIPFKGSPEGLTEVMVGRVDFYFCPLLPALSLIQAGQLIPLAVSSAQRDPRLPDVPTTTEAGFPNSEYNFWFGVFAPAKTPREITQRLYQALATARADPEVSQKLATLGVQPMPLNPDEFQAYVAKELEQNEALAKAAGIKPE